MPNYNYPGYSKNRRQLRTQEDQKPFKGHGKDFETSPRIANWSDSERQQETCSQNDLGANRQILAKDLIHAYTGFPRKLNFLSKLLSYMKSRNQHKRYETLPLVGSGVIDLYCLYSEVTRRGGIHQVIASKTWKEVVSCLNVRSANLSSALRHHYIRYLFDFEQKDLFGIETLIPIEGPLPQKKVKAHHKANNSRNQEISRTSVPGDHRSSIRHVSSSTMQLANPTLLRKKVVLKGNISDFPDQPIIRKRKRNVCRKNLLQNYVMNEIASCKCDIRKNPDEAIGSIAESLLSDVFAKNVWALNHLLIISQDKDLKHCLQFNANAGSHTKTKEAAKQSPVFDALLESYRRCSKIRIHGRTKDYKPFEAKFQFRVLNSYLGNSMSSLCAYSDIDKSMSQRRCRIRLERLLEQTLCIFQNCCDFLANARWLAENQEFLLLLSRHIRAKNPLISFKALGVLASIGRYINLIHQFEDRVGKHAAAAASTANVHLMPFHVFVSQKKKAGSKVAQPRLCSQGVSTSQEYENTRCNYHDDLAKWPCIVLLNSNASHCCLRAIQSIRAMCVNPKNREVVTDAIECTGALQGLLRWLMVLYTIPSAQRQNLNDEEMKLLVELSDQSLKCLLSVVCANSLLAERLSMFSCSDVFVDYILKVEDRPEIPFVGASIPATSWVYN